MTVSSASVSLKETPRRRVKRRLTISEVLCAIVIGIAAILAIAGPALAPHDPDAVDLANANVGTTLAGFHPLGFDAEGRDLLSRVLAGARTSMVGPLIVVLIAVSLGSLVAVAAAWVGGWLDMTAGAVLDVIFAFPGLLLAVLATAVFGPGLTAAAMALVIAYVPYVARVLRASALRERSRDYVAALEVQGQPALAICLRHILPNMFRVIVAEATILFGWAMLDLAAISFLGLGVQPPAADWGVMVSEGEVGVLQGYPGESLAAGIAIVLVVVAFNVAGERLATRASEGNR
ncbi:ABC transporter permease [Nocardioides sp. CER19]|uniref:ABC transporter permease n=1 Tax=Nocardioides sp. CER19 TaxID=3038538 RepID=UPI00244BB82D|nr:ABC transporter permease [Nocardioides sp. CER19]MDH2416110.1 ABC transporter permease [Nocardioides sp. CER19]